MTVRRERPPASSTHPREAVTTPGPAQAPEDDDYPGMPPRGGTVHRHTGRVIPFDAQDRALLLLGSEPDRPHWRFWFTIGGMADPGESLRQAAARELSEEAGIALDEVELAQPCLEAAIQFDWAGRRVVQRQTFFSVRLPPGATPDLSGLDAVERATTFGWGLRSVAELAAEPDSLATPDLPRYVTQALAQLRDREADGA